MVGYLEFRTMSEVTPEGGSVLAVRGRWAVSIGM